MNKFILIGIDAATWEVIDPLINAGYLPTISKLIKNGVKTNLKSLSGYKSPALWNVIATGKFPEENGILYFTNLHLNIPKLNIRKDITTNFLINWPYRFGKLFSNNRKSPSRLTKWFNKLNIYLMLKIGWLFEKLSLGGNYLITSNSKKEKPIWDILSEDNVTCGVIGWLVTWPAQKINGWIVSQKAVESTNKLQINIKKTDGIEDKISYPSFLSNLIKECKLSPKEITNEEIELFFNNISKEEISSIRNNNFNKKDRLNFFSYLYVSDLFSTKVSEKIKEEHKPDFLTVYLPGLDGIQHIFWQYHESNKFNFTNIEKEELNKFKDVIKNYYKFLDKQIEKIIDDKSIIMIVSDHGMDSIAEKHYDPKSIRSGQHENSPDGILILNGPNIKKNISIKEAHILDIAPTVLYLMGKPIDVNMEGIVLEDAFTEDFKHNNSIKKKNYGKIKFSDSNNQYSKEEEEKVKERLEALGYLD